MMVIMMMMAMTMMAMTTMMMMIIRITCVIVWRCQLQEKLASTLPAAACAFVIMIMILIIMIVIIMMMIEIVKWKSVKLSVIAMQQCIVILIIMMTIIIAIIMMIIMMMVEDLDERETCKTLCHCDTTWPSKVVRPPSCNGRTGSLSKYFVNFLKNISFIDLLSILFDIFV